MESQRPGIGSRQPEVVAARERFLNRLRDKLKALPPDGRTPHPGARPRGNTLSTREEWVEQFAAEWQRVGGELYRLEKDASLGSFLSRFVAEAGGGPVLRTADPRWEAAGVDAALEAAGIVVYPWGGPGGVSREQAATATVGLTWADAVAARTGTLVEIPSPEKGRVAGLLPPIHVAVVDVRTVQPDRGAVFRWLREQGFPFRTLTLITGPSRTADIQNDLTIGVHGPKRVVAVLWEDPGNKSGSSEVVDP